MDIEKYKGLLPYANYGQFSDDPSKPDDSGVYHPLEGKYKFAGFLDSILGPVCDQGTVVEGMQEAFDIRNASGEQLDIIGELVGLSRMLAKTPDSPLIIDGENLGYTREMTDDEYRIMLLLKIARNEWDGTNEGAVKIYRSVFNDDVRITFIDNQDMTVTINVAGAFTTRQVEILNFTETVLVPLGIETTVNIIGGEVEMSNYFDADITGIEHIESVTCT